MEDALRFSVLALFGIYRNACNMCKLAFKAFRKTP